VPDLTSKVDDLLPIQAGHLEPTESSIEMIGLGRPIPKMEVSLIGKMLPPGLDRPIQSVIEER